MSSLTASSQKCAHGATKRYAVVPGTTVRLLTKTTKMPGPSWSMPAHRACPRANGAICDSCYASKAARAHALEADELEQLRARLERQGFGV